MNKKSIKMIQILRQVLLLSSENKFPNLRATNKLILTNLIVQNASTSIRHNASLNIALLDLFTKEENTLK